MVCYFWTGPPLELPSRGHFEVTDANDDEDVGSTSDLWVLPKRHFSLNANELMPYRLPAASLQLQYWFCPLGGEGSQNQVNFKSEIFGRLLITAFHQSHVTDQLKWLLGPNIRWHFHLRPYPCLREKKRHTWVHLRRHDDAFTTFRKPVIWKLKGGRDLLFQSY